MLSENDIESIAVKHEDFGFGQVDRFGYTTHGFLPEGLRAFVAEVRKDDEALIRQMLEALEWEADSWKTDPERTKSAIAAARARLIDSDLSKLTERGAKAWAGVDPQKLREGKAL